jgi:putative oxidoreductase
MRLLPLLSRVALAAPFVWLGYEAVAEPGMRVKVAADFGVPESAAEAAVRLNGAVMVAGGLGMATGILPRLSAAGVVGSMIPTTLAGHSFWNDSDPQASKANRIQFLKNLGLIGGLLAVAAAADRADKSE